jgi:pimeloyl-ACP methyl ester carboxylesterase
VSANVPAVRRLALTVAVLLLAIGCATPIGVARKDPEAVHRYLTRNVLSNGEPSGPTLWTLQRLGLPERFEKDPAGTLALLHQGLAAGEDEDGRLFALAELSALHGERTGDRSWQLASAIYAYAFLFPGPGRPGPSPSDPRLRLALDLYNLGVAQGFASPDGSAVLIEAGSHTLPFGELTVRIDPGETDWVGWRLDRLASAANLEVRGLRNRYRDPGIGAPVAASLARPEGVELPPGASRIPPRLKVPATVLLRLDDPRAAIRSGHLSGRLEIATRDSRGAVRIDGRELPLEFETTVALAYTLEGSPIFDFDIAGFRSADFLPSGMKLSPDRIAMLDPYRPGRIPLVLVHGTASSPATWAEMVNELQNDPGIAAHYEIWLFLYNTSNPVLYSASLLRDGLTALVAQLDPAGTDPALRRMVVMGHSQGGLLTKLMAVSSGQRFWQNVSDIPFEDAKFEPETRKLLAHAIFFEPLPFVSRVVFLATPHHGSYRSSLRIGELVARLVKLPTNLLKFGLELASTDPQSQARFRLRRLPTSVDNMTAGNPFIAALNDLPIATGVSSNSVIGVLGEGPVEQGADGVVEYRSAHLDGVDSEKVVRSGHSVQNNPDAIEEVKRILRVHAAAP